MEGAAPEISGYETLTDDTGVLTVDVPIEWDDIDTDARHDVGRRHRVRRGSWPRRRSPSTTPTYTTPGLVFTGLCHPSSLDETLAEFAPAEGECTDAGIEDYDDGVYTGRFQTFTDCDGTGTVYVTVAAVPADNSFTAIVVMQLVSDADLEVLDQVFATFTVTP